jgi:hypothetical protein
MTENSLDTKPNSVSLLNETNILNRRIGSIPQWDVVKRAATTSKEYVEFKLDAKIQTTSNNDPSIFDDAYDDNERQISGLSYYSALQMLSSSASAETGKPITNNTYSRDINFGNDGRRKPLFSRIVTSDESWVAAKDDSKSIINQSPDVNTIQDRRPLTKETNRAFTQELAENPGSTRRPFRANDTIRSLAVVASSGFFMPKTDNRDVAANNEADTTISNIASMTEQEKVQLVISNASLCDTRFSRSIQPPLLSTSEKLSGVTFVGDDEITDADILSGRGGKSNHHVGNKRFRHLVSEMKTMYRSAGQKTDKTALSQGIIAYVHSYGGRFLIQDRTSNDPKWRVMTTLEARKKTSQALRETKALKWTLDEANSVIEST